MLQILPNGKNPEHETTPYIHYFVAETGSLLEPHELQTVALAARRVTAIHSRAVRGHL
jgi:hypothetical protein